MGHVHLEPIRSIPSLFLKSNKEYNNLIWSINVWITCSYVTHEISIKWKKSTKFSNFKFWLIIIVQVVGVNFKLQKVRTHWSLWWLTFLALFPTYATTCLVTQVTCWFKIFFIKTIYFLNFALIKLLYFLVCWTFLLSFALITFASIFTFTNYSFSILLSTFLH